MKRVKWAMTVLAAGALAACGFEGMASRGADLEVFPGGDASPAREGGTPDEDAGFETDANVWLDAEADRAVPHPESCTEVPSAANGDVTLYVAHDPGRPWMARCGPAGQTYLPLPAGPSKNYSSYPANNCAEAVSGSGGAVKTSWTHVRIDPVSFVVTTNDYTFATSTGATHEVSGNGTVDFVYARMPFATARICDDDSDKIGAKIDLEGTKFRIAPDQFIVEGFTPAGTPSTDGQRTDLVPKGLPGGMHACRPAGTDYYQRNGGACLTLEYVP